jgi:nicotinamide-nucleotide adenylyltransferase
LEVIRVAAESAREVVVVVGSAQSSHTHRDPLTAGERIEALSGMLKDEGLGVSHVIPVVDLNQYHLWVAHVEAQVPAFDLVVAASPMTLHLFNKAGYATKRVEVTNREVWSGTNIRRLLFEAADVSHAVTPAVAGLLARPEVQARLRAIAGVQRGSQG